MGRQRRRRPTWGLWAGAALVAAFFVALWVVSQFKPKDPGSRAVRYVTVAPGSTADEVALTLQRAGVIKSVWPFEILSRWDKSSTRLTAGVYRLSPSMPLSTILDKITRGETAVVRVAIPEGATVQEIVARLVRAHIGHLNQYQALERHPLPGMPAPAKGVRDPLEGYLFPATYSFPYGTTPREALTTMWRTFQHRVEKGLYAHSHSKLTLAQWVTLASIVQAEDSSGTQATDVAAVFYNRLAAGMRFQSDATVRYAIGHPVAGGLTLNDLTVASPYNTYQHAGLPPGPIDNPGLAILKASLRPARVSYLYFLSLRNGQILFATTYQQHLANIAKANATHGQ
nr:endolytic transglycosylase MltG [Sulfobacillus harzensis]